MTPAIERLKKAVADIPRGHLDEGVERFATVRPRDVLEAAAAVHDPDQIVRDLAYGSGRAGNAPEVHIYADHCHHLIEQAEKGLQPTG